MTPLALRMLINACTYGDGINATEHIGNSPQMEIVKQFTDEGVIDAAGMGTDKARAWLDLILATPLPVQQWVDPRTSEPEYQFRRVAYEPGKGIVTTLSPAKEEGPADTSRVFGNLNPSHEQKAAAYAATVPKPPEGFTHHVGLAWTDTDNEGNQRAVFMPRGLKPGDDVELWYRDGKSGKQAKVGKRADVMPAASVNWQHRGGDDDVIGYRTMDMPAVNKIVMPKK